MCTCVARVALSPQPLGPAPPGPESAQMQQVGRLLTGDTPAGRAALERGQGGSQGLCRQEDGGPGPWVERGRWVEATGKKGSPRLLFGCEPCTGQGSLSARGAGGSGVPPRECCWRPGLCPRDGEGAWPRRERDLNEDWKAGGRRLPTDVGAHPSLGPGLLGKGGALACLPRMGLSLGVKGPPGACRLWGAGGGPSRSTQGLEIRGAHPHRGPALPKWPSPSPELTSFT